MREAIAANATAALQKSLRSNRTADTRSASGTATRESSDRKSATHSARSPASGTAAVELSDQQVNGVLRSIPGVLVGLGGFEPPTSPLSGVRSNQLSYRPNYSATDYCSPIVKPYLISRTFKPYFTAYQYNQAMRVSTYQSKRFSFKEVIQPQVPLGLPCYDFTPVADPTVARCLLKG